MATSPAPETKTIRISQVAGRYLLFDLADVMHLRRAHGMCSVLVGTNPQAPNQNLFSGLPLELLPEEAALLVRRGDAYLADDPSAHLEALTRSEAQRRRDLYADAHRACRVEARVSIEEASAVRSRAAKALRDARAAEGKNKKKKGKGDADPAINPAPAEVEDPAPHPAAAEAAPEPTLFSSPAAAAAPAAPSETDVGGPGGIYMTPSTSAGLLAADGDALGDHPPPAAPEMCPLYSHLSSRGYFMTPGLRFGGKYSVYPGDPFRFHAHFIANSYGWDEEVEVIDLVGTGRLAGAVKKGLLLGAEEPGEGSGETDGRNVRTFCLEWAGI